MERVSLSDIYKRIFNQSLNRAKEESIWVAGLQLVVTLHSQSQNHQLISPLLTLPCLRSWQSLPGQSAIKLRRHLQRCRTSSVTRENAHQIHNELQLHSRKGNDNQTESKCWGGCGEAEGNAKRRSCFGKQPVSSCLLCGDWNLQLSC